MPLQINLGELTIFFLYYNYSIFYFYNFYVFCVWSLLTFLNVGVQFSLHLKCFRALVSNIPFPFVVARYTCIKLHEVFIHSTHALFILKFFIFNFGLFFLLYVQIHCCVLSSIFVINPIQCMFFSKNFVFTSRSKNLGLLKKCLPCLFLTS